MPAFKRAYKKLHKQDKIQVNDAIKKIAETPELGQEKKGDLSGVFVYKFKVNKQEKLLAYEWDAEEVLLHLIGTHENYYRDLKRNL